MQLHELKPTHKAKKKKRVGRGGKRGTYSGRGVKGQKSRAGRKMVPAIRGMIKRYPKLRGYRQGEIAKNLIVLNLNILEKGFETGETVNPQNLLPLKLNNFR
ncbi:uL15 family ribosomal protein [Patescibacteria group bacterium]|nr:uL15 family ribosomal protein [Patescibacteria group bacterium]